MEFNTKKQTKIQKKCLGTRRASLAAPVLNYCGLLVTGSVVATRPHSEPAPPLIAHHLQHRIPNLADTGQWAV